MIKYLLKKKGETEFTSVKDYIKGCWVRVIDPSEKEVEALVKKFDLDKGNVLDGLDVQENPRCEINDKTAYIFLNTPTENVPSEYDSSFLIIYSKDLFMTISRYPLEVIDTLLKTKSPAEKCSFPRLLLKLLFLISRNFELSVRKTLRSIRKNKKDLNKLTDKDIVELIKEEDKINQYIPSFGAMIQTYRRILRDKTIKLFKKDENILEDLIIDLDETHTICDDALKSISNMRNYYSTKLSNDLNKKVTILTLFTIFLTIPTLIAGIYGMNVTLPMQTSQNILLTLALVVAGLWAIMFAILKHSKFI